jgi:3-deoxy-D-manno-octulosonic-acid transferase
MVWRRLRGRPQPAATVGRTLGLVAPRASQRPCIWLQGEGLGELTVLLSLVPHLEEAHPDCDLVVVTATSSGYELARKRLIQHRVLYCPLDLPWSIANVLDRIRPTALVVVERAEHPRLIATAKARGIPLTLVNARILNREHRGHLPPRAVQRMVQRYDCVLAQTDEDARLFVACGVEPARVSVSGAVKFDNAQFDRQNPTTRRLARLAQIEANDVVFLAGSTRDGENEIVVRVFASLWSEFPQLRLVIVPRNARRFDDVCRDLHARGVPFERRSRLEARSEAQSNAPPRALVVDVFGELPAWWGLARIGFVGNSLTQHGGQNMIEPAAYGVATSFGPHNENFQDVVTLLTRASGAEIVHSEAELRAFVRRCLLEPEYAEQLGRRAQAAVASRRGALARTIDHLEEFLGDAGLLAVEPLAHADPAARHLLRRAS